MRVSVVDSGTVLFKCSLVEWYQYRSYVAACLNVRGFESSLSVILSLVLDTDMVYEYAKKQVESVAEVAKESVGLSKFLLPVSSELSAEEVRDVRDRFMSLNVLHPFHARLRHALSVPRALSIVVSAPA